MSPALTEVARRFADHQSWAWVEGMHTVDQWTVVSVDRCGSYVTGYQLRDKDGRDVFVAEMDDSDIPDLTHPLTLGLAMLWLGIGKEPRDKSLIDALLSALREA